ncbi:MAG: hypothetical protein HXX08_23470 [Chloroflexi bacterium]|uniref:Plasmid pRiA4b ORF-3 family protein n=1 Tax=Candidatus Chlorohelix allophototropha TaxID=3003348 RepID=A0A8T7M9M1_9CHLR|nr:hypothetical protein [Chloroflexota bacterium]WJW68762.1 plasmid pRiA4b ORF-3 family protein [Chloroflexota bacterium L227-S17]
MARVSSKGKCEFCQTEFSKAGMTKHLTSCPSRFKAGVTPTDKPSKLLHLVVTSKDSPLYWLHLEIRADTSLVTLDEYLRAIWVECCGHLSAFTIGDESYISSVDPDYDTGDEDMWDVKLENVVAVGQSFDYEYDFGSTTELKLKVVGEREGILPLSSPIQLLARNNAPEFACEVCGEPATSICSQCIWEDDGSGFVCEEHEEDHECEEDMLLPVVNSPRMGVCAYCG